MPLYFAYGSNLSWEQIQKRCPSAKYITNAVLPDHELLFTRESKTTWECGVADAVYKQDGEVWGVVYEINEKDLLALDKNEGFYGKGKKNSYNREPTEVVCVNNNIEKKARVDIYFAVCQENPPLPSQEYKDVIVNGAKYWKFPEHYISELGKIKTT
jgi:gamma-glutamylcyclotransferase (GGCT)/AIG2-like uncharacterized protein YtfP